MNIFALASKNKYRFESTRGKITTEDLWNLNLETLDSMAVELDSTVSDGSPKSFLSNTSNKKSTQFEEDSNKLEILKFIIQTKEAEHNAILQARDNKAKRQRIMEIMMAKQDDALQGKSMDELQALLAELK